jgi:hypothetical protein
VRYTTSPLVLDLDGDGLQLSTERVRFDLRATGQPQRVTWVGPREGFWAMDLNGDGRVTSGRELFGNHSDCHAEKCADGATALAIYDNPVMGAMPMAASTAPTGSSTPCGSGWIATETANHRPRRWEP